MLCRGLPGLQIQLAIQSDCWRVITCWSSTIPLSYNFSFDPPKTVSLVSPDDNPQPQYHPAATPITTLIVAVP